jgi:hypothetical protein
VVVSRDSYEDIGATKDARQKALDEVNPSDKLRKEVV